MNMDPRVALTTLTNALEEHLLASLNRRGDEDPAVENAFYRVADAFESYEDALFSASGEVTPLDLYDEDEDTDDQDERVELYEDDDTEQLLGEDEVDHDDDEDSNN